MRIRCRILALSALIASAGCSGGNGGNPADRLVLVGPVSGATTEGGGQATFSVALNAKPGDAVIVTLVSSDTAEVTVSPSTLTFTPVDFAAPQTVTVTGTDDDAADGNVTTSVTVSPAGSPDEAYAELPPIDLPVVNIDDETAGIGIGPVSGPTTEWGGQASFTVVLHSEPASDVVVSLDSDTASEGIATPQSLTFTPANWNAAQTITITGVDDDLADGNQAYAVTFSPVSSTDAGYDALSLLDLPLVNVDDETAGFTVSAASGPTGETGGTASFTVRLNSQPTADVTVNFDTTDAGEGTPDVTSLTFTAANWADEQTVTVTGIDDLLDDGDQPYSIAFAATASVDSAYAALVPPDPAFTNVDNEMTVTLDAVHRGWWSSAGNHAETNENTAAGWCPTCVDDEFNAYFTFDLAGLPGTIASAELNLELEFYDSADASETLSVWDVSTDVDTLDASGSGQTAIFTDLQSGNSYGTFPVQSSEVGTVRQIPMGAQAVTDLNATAGDFAVGIHVDTLARSTGQELIRFSEALESRIHRLVLVVSF